MYKIKNYKHINLRYREAGSRRISISLILLLAVSSYRIQHIRRKIRLMLLEAIWQVLSSVYKNNHQLPTL